MKPLVKIQNVSFRYHLEGSDEAWVLRGVHLDIREGETVAIIGPNGSGKSTLTKLINGLLQPSKGEITVDGLNPAAEDEVWSVRQRVGMVFQNPDNQIVAPTVRDDIAFGLENLGIPRERMIARVREAVKWVGLEGMEDMAPNRLSGGQKQRLAIAGVLAMRPKLIIMDEATAMLDPQGRKEIAKVVQLLKRESITVIMVTHILEDVWAADRVIVMGNGQIQFTGTPEDVFKRSDDLRSLGLDVPFSVTLQQALMKYGLPLPDEALDERKLVNALWKLWGKT